MTLSVPLVLLSIPQRDGISLMLRLGVLGGSCGGGSMVAGEVLDPLLCLLVDEMGI
jgi:hypothetical protein